MALWPSELGNYFVCKRLAVQNFDDNTLDNDLAFYDYPDRVRYFQVPLCCILLWHYEVNLL